jgi:hypothetical protein
MIYKQEETIEQLNLGRERKCEKNENEEVTKKRKE